MNHFYEDAQTLPTNLPVHPELGWLDSTGNIHELGIWRGLHLTGGWGIGNERGRGHRALDDEITKFTPAVAVPKDALGKLRAALLTYMPTPEDVISEVTDFLAAVDEANT